MQQPGNAPPANSPPQHQPNAPRPFSFPRHPTFCTWPSACMKRCWNLRLLLKNLRLSVSWPPVLVLPALRPSRLEPTRYLPAFSPARPNQSHWQCRRTRTGAAAAGRPALHDPRTVGSHSEGCGPANPEETPKNWRCVRPLRLRITVATRASSVTSDVVVTNRNSWLVPAQTKKKGLRITALSNSGSLRAEACGNTT